MPQLLRWRWSFVAAAARALAVGAGSTSAQTPPSRGDQAGFEPGSGTRVDVAATVAESARDAAGCLHGRRRDRGRLIGRRGGGRRGGPGWGQGRCHGGRRVCPLQRRRSDLDHRHRWGSTAVYRPGRRVPSDRRSKQAGRATAGVCRSQAHVSLHQRRRGTRISVNSGCLPRCDSDHPQR
jgi:hypothetical protein